MKISKRWKKSFFAFAHIVGILCLVTAGAMLLPIICSLFYGEGDIWALLLTAGLSAGVGYPMWRFFKSPRELSPREAFIIATFGWVIISAISAIPFVIHGAIPSYTDAFFEMVSGYTTTGATILTDIEAMPHGLLLWRSESHLLGGMGFITLAIILLPHGMGGLRLFRADASPGQVVTGERFMARNRDAVVSLWKIYLSVNLLLICMLLLGGMSLFDSLCHTFGAFPTAGFSPYNASIGHYDNAYFDWVISLFMFLGGITFVVFYFIVRRKWKQIFINTELRWYFMICLFFCAVVSCILWSHGVYDFSDSVRHGTFQTLSLLTTTGFASQDYEMWPQAAQMFLYTVCFIGACAGSTTSGIKIIHYVLLWKFIVAVIKKAFFRPLSVISVRINNKRIDQMIINIALCYFIINFFMIFVGSCFLVLVDDINFDIAMKAIVATLMNIGPSFAELGPTDNFSWISDTGKWYLSFNMLLGRLEMFSALVLLYPSFWKD